MSMLVNPYWLTPPLTEGTLALAEYTGSDGDTSDPVPFAGEVYDTGGFWNSGSNTTLSIPAGRSGLIRYQFSQYSVDGSLYYAQEESTSVSARGYVHKATGVSLSESGGGGMSAPIAVTGGEDFELSLKSGSTDTDFCWHSIEVLDPDMSRALAYLTSGQTISAADTRAQRTRRGGR